MFLKNATDSNDNGYVNNLSLSRQFEDTHFTLESTV